MVSQFFVVPLWAADKIVFYMHLWLGYDIKLNVEVIMALSDTLKGPKNNNFKHLLSFSKTSKNFIPLTLPPEIQSRPKVLGSTIGDRTTQRRASQRRTTQCRILQYRPNVERPNVKRQTKPEA
jgi:hypothetical protein